MATLPLLDVALDLSTSLAAADRYQRLVEALLRVVPADAAVLLRLDGGALQVLAAVGLVPEAHGRRFDPAEHPRLDAILRGLGPVRFPGDDPRPDPYDGLIAGGWHVHEVHSCMGAALRVGGEVVGVLTADACRPGVFEGLDPDVFATFAALAAAGLRTAALIEALEERAERRGALSRRLVAEVLHREGGELIGASPVMRALHEELEAVAGSDLGVLLLGETGVGKELAARTLHARSARADAPLVTVNCASLTESVAESELVGHARGAFTGAVGERMGPFELAHGGTLLLDEVGELPLSVQPRLLRALQQGEVRRVGAERPRRVDVRVIAATNRDLAEEVRLGRFRADLYHRLAVYPIHVPPLRARGDDVLLLAGRFLELARARLGSGPLQLSAEALDALRAWSWPGNVRELEHTLLRAALRATGARRGQPATLLARHLELGPAVLEPPTAAPPPAEPAPRQRTLSEAMDAHQRALVSEALRASGGSGAEAGRRLGVDRGNLQRLAQRLGVRRDETGAARASETEPREGT